MPRQSGLIPVAEGRVEFLPAFASGDFVRGLEAFSHIWLITGFHQNPPWEGASTVRPPRLGGNARVGVFASRAPQRPNGLGLSLVELLGIEPGFLRVAGIDCVDGTPVYDIKPYLPWAESQPGARADWASAPPPTRDPASIIIPPEIAARLPEEVVKLVRQVLTLDLHPAYQDPTSTDRIYGTSLAGWNIRWRNTPEALTVVEANKLEP